MFFKRLVILRFLGMQFKRFSELFLQLLLFACRVFSDNFQFIFSENFFIRLSTCGQHQNAKSFLHRIKIFIPSENYWIWIKMDLFYIQNNIYFFFSLFKYSVRQTTRRLHLHLGKMLLVCLKIRDKKLILIALCKRFALIADVISTVLELTLFFTELNISSS